MLPTKTIYLLLTGTGTLSICTHRISPAQIYSNNEFAVLENSLDNVFRELRVEGVGSQSKSAEGFTKDEEEKLWCSGVLSTPNPKAQLRAVILNGKNFCLGGGEEHPSFKLSQLKHEPTPPKYISTEYASKNRAGGLAKTILLRK